MAYTPAQRIRFEVNGDRAHVYFECLYVDTNDGYRQPGAAWNDVFIVRTGGEARKDGNDKVTKGYGMLHALNACATTEQDRIRWIAEIPHATKDEKESLGAPTVTGGIVFVGTDQGYLVVLGDPSVIPADGMTCSNVDYNNDPSACMHNGFHPVPKPKVLAEIRMPDGGNIAGLRSEPALAGGRVFVSSLSGHVYMFDGFAPPALTAFYPNQTPCGAAADVTITGENFNDVVDINLRDDTGATHQVDFNPSYTSTQITAQIPTTISSGPYDIIVRTKHGISPPLGRFFVTPIVTSISPSSGPATGGTEVTVNGTCFHKDMGVYFGSTQATTLAGEGCASDTQCIVFSPAASAFPVDVVADIHGARSAPPAPQFSYTGPDITGVSPRSGPITGGTPMDITGTGFPAYDGIHSLNTQVSFDGVQTMAACYLIDCELQTPPAPHPGPVHIVATAFGVSSTPSEKDQFTYNQYPALTKFLAPGSNSVDGSVYLDGNAPDDPVDHGAAIILTSSDPSAVSLPPSGRVIIPAGANWTSVPVTFLPTSRTETVTLTAAYQGSSTSATVNVSAWPPLSIALDADELGKGESTPATVTLNPPAPSGGAVIALLSSDQSAVSIVPQNVPISAGNYIGTSVVTNNYSGRPKTVTITATYGGVSASASLLVPTPPDPCRHCQTPQKCCECNGGTWDRGRCE